MSKTIVICCDGTGNEFGPQVSNVVKLYQTLVQGPAQVTYYHPGVGTLGARAALSRLSRWWTKVLGLAFGYGLADNVADAYLFLMRVWEPGDRIFVFGFSRGAYTARVLCGMLHMVGLLTGGNEGLVPYAVRLVKNKRLDFAVAAGFKRTFARPCPVHFLGVWDTVSSVGWVYDAVHFPFTKATHNPELQVARHAISIDERRAFFRQNSLGMPAGAQQDVKEVWFAGVHCDVGGGYPEPESQLAQISLKWMLCEAELAGLQVDQDRKAAILGGQAPHVAPDPGTRYLHNSLTGVWNVAELWPKVVHRQGPDGRWHAALRLNLWRRRFIPDGALVHASVAARLGAKALTYAPSNLPSSRQTSPGC